MSAALDALAVGLSDSVKQSIEDAICSAERARVEREIAECFENSEDVWYKGRDVVAIVLSGEYRKEDTNG